VVDLGDSSSWELYHRRKWQKHAALAPKAGPGLEAWTARGATLGWLESIRVWQGASCLASSSFHIIGLTGVEGRKGSLEAVVCDDGGVPACKRRSFLHRLRGIDESSDHRPTSECNPRQPLETVTVADGRRAQNNFEHASRVPRETEERGRNASYSTEMEYRDVHVTPLAV